MSRGYPSMVALLGLLAVAGYQNRDKLQEMLRNLGQSGPGGPPDQGSRQDGLGGLLGSLGDTSVGSLLSGGLADLAERFKQNGQGETVESWIGHGPNREIAPHQLEQAIGPDVLATLSQRTGLSREEILSRLTRDLPQAVDEYTPDGRLPTEGGSSRR